MMLELCFNGWNGYPELRFGFEIWLERMSGTLVELWNLLKYNWVVVPISEIRDWKSGSGPEFWT